MVKESRHPVADLALKVAGLGLEGIPDLRKSCFESNSWIRPASKSRARGSPVCSHLPALPVKKVYDAALVQCGLQTVLRTVHQDAASDD